MKVKTIDPIQLSCSSSDPTNPTYGALNFVHQITDVAGLSAVLVKQYSFYRISGVEIVITNKEIQKVNPVLTGSGTSGPQSRSQFAQTTEFLLIPNRDGTTYSSSVSKETWNDAKEYTGAIWCRNIRAQSKKKFVTKPNTLTMAYENLANTGYIPKYSQWIRNNDMGVPHYSWTLLFKESSYYTERYDVSLNYIVQFKEMGKDVAS